MKLTKENTTTYEEILNFLVEKATPEEILNFKVSEAAQERADRLTERNKAGILTAEERTELERTLNYYSFMTLLKAKAAASLKHK